jgi:YHS domain-containing protein
MKKLFSGSLLAILLIGLAFAQTTEKQQEGNVYSIEDSGVKHFICPVKGTDTVVSKDTPYSDYDGKRYYFCCIGCKSEFDASPAKFIQRLTLPANGCNCTPEGKHICFADCKAKCDKNPEKCGVKCVCASCKCCCMKKHCN